MENSSVVIFSISAVSGAGAGGSSGSSSQLVQETNKNLAQLTTASSSSSSRGISHGKTAIATGRIIITPQPATFAIFFCDVEQKC